MFNPDGLSDHVIILGDEAKSTRALERVLEAAGHQAVSSCSFELAFEQIYSRRVSLILIDLNASSLMGSLIQPAADDSGESLRRHQWAQEALGFCKLLKSSDATSELPILVLSKSHRAQDAVACLNAGATDYITKPCQRTELLSRVKAMLRSWQLERERKERFEQLNVLHSVSSVLSSSLEPEALLRGTLSVLVRFTHADRAVAYLRNTDGHGISLVTSEAFPAEDETRGGLLDLFSRIEPLMEGRPLSLDPLPDSARAGLAGPATGDINSLVCAPIGLKGQMNGAVCLFSSEPGSFLNQQADLLSTICNQLSVALENARLFVETKKSASQLSFVYNLGNNLMNSLEMDELLGYAVFSVGRSLQFDVCAVIVRATGEAETPACARFSRSHDARAGSEEWYDPEGVKAYLDLTTSAVQRTIETRVARRLLRDLRVTTETIVPLSFDDRLLGLMICGSYTSSPVSLDDQKLLGAVAQQLSLAIRNTELYKRTKDTSINLAVEVSRRTQEIEEQKRFTEKIIDSLPVSLYVVDRDMRIVAWNRNREVGGLGISRDVVMGRNVFNVLARQPRRLLEDEFVQVFRTGEMVRMEQDSFFDGQKKVWKISKIPMRVDNAEVTHVITVGEDITDQKKMNEAVIHAEKLASIGRLAAGVVHEINNPLATIAACAEALSARVDEMESQEMNEDFSEYLQIIRDEAFRCKAITNSLLDFSHQRQAEKLTSDINHIIEQTLQLIKHHPKLGKMKVVKELELKLEPVYVNEGQMKQIFIALISNAFDAMESGGVLTIRTRCLESGGLRNVCAEFTDTGCGIPASHVPKIFDPFFTTKPLGRGTGLGLSVCYGIVSEHGGKIEVDSKEGEGSTFRILLPISNDETAPEAGMATLLGESAIQV